MSSSSAVAFRIRTNIGNFKVSLPNNSSPSGSPTVLDLKKALQQQHLPLIPPEQQVLQLSENEVLTDYAMALSSVPNLTRDTILTLAVKLEKTIVEKSYIGDGGVYVAAGTVQIKALQSENMADSVAPQPESTTSTGSLMQPAQPTGTTASNSCSNSGSSSNATGDASTSNNVVSLIDDTPFKDKPDSVRTKRGISETFPTGEANYSSTGLYDDYDFEQYGTPEQVRDAIPARRMRLIDDSPQAPPAVLRSHVRTVYCV
jgi:hypothetical protein